MTQPTSVNMTFDTSLVDVNPPRVDESDSTLDLQQQQQQQTPTSSAPPVQHVPTQDAYDQWAAIYDTDGNMLQAIDDLELASLLPCFLASVASAASTSRSGSSKDEVSVLDLGCGTGRNMMKILGYDWCSSSSSSSSSSRRVNVIGLDFSQKMLDIAAGKLAVLMQDKTSTTTSTTSPIPASLQNLPPVDAAISTLVLEHIPLPAFFATLTAVLRRGGMALVTNMHEDMGRVSQAGFLNEEGVKVRGSSFVYSVGETVGAAREAGFEVVRVVERGDGEGGCGGGEGGGKGGQVGWGEGVVWGCC
ncbi:methyltransferase small domain-containing [Pyrenophora seminiperda CCB06]|uniref:Methyltransferase small domain-containing n=1 Tax=Pyrenophora seminiperda CCB06 TaxID=1302712 RepID=A0A3M7M9Z6_9PLEO|nr:methyltransferase small domain-containing [Pyrenophora seminiperda CCB06]